MEYMLLDGGFIGAAFLISVLISYFAIPVITEITEKRHLFDHPDDDRKLHTEAVPTLGGVAIFSAFMLSFALSSGAVEFTGFSYLVSALLILFFVGLKDDLVVLSAWKKLLAQIAAATLVIYGCGIQITSFHGVLGVHNIPDWAGIGISLFSIIVVINAVNLIDGIDGLAGGIGALSSVLFGAGFLYVGQLPMALFSFCLAGALVGFLYYNFEPASIFMGDTGSMLLGFLLSVQAIEFIQLSSHPTFVSRFSDKAPILTVAILSFPLYDTLRVVFKRIWKKDSIFKPGQDHVHHELLRMGLSHRSASLLLYGESLLVITIIGSLSVLNINVNILLGILLVGSMLVYPTNGFKRKIFSKIFGYHWLAYRGRTWGVEIDYSKMRSINGSSGNGKGAKDYSMKNGKDAEKEEEEISSIAV